MPLPRPYALRRGSSSWYIRRAKRIAAVQGPLFEHNETKNNSTAPPPTKLEESTTTEGVAASLQPERSLEYFVDFIDENDPRDPFNWPAYRKWIVVAIISSVGFLGNLGTTICIPAVPQILDHSNSQNKLYETALVSVWEIGQAVGPLFVAPLSEIFGRAPIYNLANVWFLVMAIACGVSQNMSMLLAFRLLNGIGDSSPSLNAGIVGDMFPQERRGLAVALTGFPPMLGPVAGPVIGGYLTAVLGWRWSFWLSAILGALCTVTFALFYSESYRPVILRHKADRLRKTTGNPTYHSKFDFDAGATRAKQYLQSISRSLYMLFRLPVVSMLAIYAAVQFGLMYVVLATNVETVENIYGFSQGAAGLSYLGVRYVD